MSMTATSRITRGRLLTVHRRASAGLPRAIARPGQSATSNLLQRTKGFGLQLTDSQNLLGWTNQAVLGADYNDSDDTFSQAYQYGQLAPDRSLLYQASPFNDETVISLRGSNKIYGAYLTDTLSPDQPVALHRLGPL